jgi:hypothetical protein
MLKPAKQMFQPARQITWLLRDAFLKLGPGLFFGVWDPSNQLRAEFYFNLPCELLKMVAGGKHTFPIWVILRALTKH